MQHRLPFLVITHAVVFGVTITTTLPARQAITTPAVCFPIEPTEETVQPNEHIATASPHPTHQENNSQVGIIVICFPLEPEPEQAPKPEPPHQGSNGQVVQENSDPPLTGGGVG